VIPERIANAWNAASSAGRVVVNILVNGLKVALVVFVVAVFFDYLRQGMVVRPISVPKSLGDYGLTDVVAAQELRQQIYAIRQIASLNDKVKLPAALSAEQPDIPVPTTSISINTIFDLLDDVLPRSPRTVVSGEFTGDNRQLRLDVLINRKEAYSEEGAPTLKSAESMIDDAARAVVIATHPDWEALDLDQSGRVKEADRLMDRVIYAPNRSSSDVAQAHLLRAWFLREEGRGPAACDEIKASLRIDPMNASAYQDLSSLLIVEGRRDQATAYAQKAVILSWGRDSFAYYALGTSYYDQGDWLDAERAYRAAIRLQQDNRFAHDVLGRVEENEGNTDAARDEYSTAIVLKSSYIEALDDRGKLLTYRIKTAEALQQAVEDFTSEGNLTHWRKADPWVGLGWANYSMGELAGVRDYYKRAWADFSDALRLDAGRTDADMGLGSVSDAQQTYSRAVGWFMAALRRDPRNNDAYQDALDALASDATAKQNVVAAKAVAKFASENPCERAAKIPSNAMIRRLVQIRCRIREPRRIATAPLVKTCEVNSNDLAMLPRTAMYYSLNAVDEITDNTRLAASILLVFAGVAAIGWSRLRAVTPKGRETASDKVENTDRPGPEA
jgi:tetratricopeptide (TPR) repeat protein